MRAAAVVGTVFACLDVAMDAWRDTVVGPDTSLDDLFDRALDAARS